MRDARLSRRELFQLLMLKTPDRGVSREATGATLDAPAVWRAVLRPPGAVGESAFLVACTACHDCVDACPFEAIAVAPDGRPFVAPAAMPCVSCLDVPCSRACGSGALVPLDHPRDIRMGTARVDPDVCVAYSGGACRACFDACPFPHAAIRLSGHEPRPVVSPSLCTGCGVCVYACPEGAVTISPANAPGPVAS